MILGEEKTVDFDEIFWHPCPQMTKDQLIFVIKKILGTDAGLEFLAKLDLAELRRLVACLGERIGGEKSRVQGERKALDRIYSWSMEIWVIGDRQTGGKDEKHGLEGLWPFLSPLSGFVVFGFGAHGHV